MADSEEEVPTAGSLQPCKICSRTFLPGPLAKHVKICEKNASKRRKVFNSLRQRVEGTELARFHLPTFKRTNLPPPQRSSAKSLDESEDGTSESLLRSSERSSIKVKSEAAPGRYSKHGSCVSVTESTGSGTEDVKSRPPTPPPAAAPQHRPIKIADRMRASISMNERCPHCERQFGPKSYDRHVEWCQEKHACLPDNSNHTNKQEAKERLEARIKYRAPPVNKRTVKEKYQTCAAAKEEPKPALQRGTRHRHTIGTLSSRNQPGPSKVAEVQKSKVQESKSVKRGVFAAKSKPITNEYNNNLTNSASVTYNPFLTAERQLMELLECNDFAPLKSSTPNNKNKTPKSKSPYLEQPLAKSITTPTSTPKPKSNARKSVIDPPTSFKDASSALVDDMDFEMLENFINDNFGNDDLIHKLDLDAISLDSCSTKAEHTASYFDDVSIDPRLINDFDNLSIPDHLDTHTTTTPDMLRQRFHDGDDSRYNRDDSLPVFYSMANVQAPAIATKQPAKGTKSDKALKSETEVKISPKQIIEEEEEVVTPKELAEPSAEMREYFMELGELFQPGDEIYEEYKMLEQIYIVERSQGRDVQAQKESVTPGVSADSAYGSLNRSPKTKIRSKVMQLSPLEQPFLKAETDSVGGVAEQQNKAECTEKAKHGGNTDGNPTVERGGGEGGIGIAPKRKPIDRNDAKSAHAVAMFCHQCGKKYPVEAARFCVWCGNKRLVL